MKVLPALTDSPIEPPRTMYLVLQMSKWEDLSQPKDIPFKLKISGPKGSKGFLYLFDTIKDAYQWSRLQGGCTIVEVTVTWDI